MRRPVAYAVGAVALVLVAATAMALGGQFANLGPWADGGSGGHGMGPMSHGGDANTTCDPDARHESGGSHGSRENRTHEGNQSCGGSGGNWTHG